MAIDPTAVIDVDELVLGEGAVIRPHAQLYGRRIVIGRDAFIDSYAVIGGGSADRGSFTAGDFLHMGMFSQVNTACDVTVGDEVGIGIGTRIFTHGAYLSEFDGFPVAFDPVTIGSRVWLPNALVMPGVTIGSDVVVAAGSVVTSDLPSGCLAAGAPARVIRKDYPQPPTNGEEILQRICDEADAGVVSGTTIITATARFEVASRRITGKPSPEADRLRNQLRRHGIRFRYDADYRSW